MNFPLPDFFPASAEIFVLVMACVVLLADLFKSERQGWLPYLLTLATLAGAFAIQVGTAGPDTTLTFSGMFVDDRLADVLKGCLYITVFTVVVYSRDYLMARGLERGEYYLLVLFATLGMQVMISANHFLTLYLGLELLSLAIYALVALGFVLFVLLLGYLGVHRTLAKALDELQARDFINEGRVIESVVHRRSGKLGAARVKQELAAKGLSGEAVAVALEGLRETEFSRAQAVWRKKFDRPAADPNERGKQIRFLMTRGFNAEVVRKIVQGADDD